MITQKTVRIVSMLLALAALTAVVAQLLWQPRSPWLRTNSVLFRTQAALGYLVGIFYTRRMAGEYAVGTGTRRAWLWMTAGVFTFFVYQSLDSVLKLFPRLWSVITEDAWLVGVSISLAFLLAGLLEMWFAFRAAALAPPMRKADWFIVSMVALLTFARVTQGLEPHYFEADVFSRAIRGAGPLLVGAGVITAFLLYRSTIEFGQGQFSRAIRGLIAFFVVHLLLFQLDWYPALWNIPAVDAVTDAIYYVLPWLLAVALANCWHVPAIAGAIVEGYRTGGYLGELEAGKLWASR